MTPACIASHGTPLAVSLGMRPQPRSRTPRPSPQSDLGSLAAVLAHEIKNPLAGISGAVQILGESLPFEDPRREVVREVLREVARLDNTVRDLLAYSQPIQPARRRFDLQDSLLRAWNTLPGSSSVRFSIEGCKGVTADADASLLHLVWSNLLQNAVEAMPAGGDLTIRVSAGPPVSVEIRDSGVGIPPQVVQRLFEPFFTTKTRGTGLGLPLCRRIVEAHGGRVRVTSAPGLGTIITVEIPE